MTVNDNFKGTVAHIKIDIAYAMNDLLRECSFDDLSVSDVCKATGISKSTFYRYFKSKYQVAAWLADIFSKNGVQQIGRTLTWYEGYLCTTTGIMKFHPFFKAASQSEASDALPRLERENRKRNMIETVVDWKYAPLTPSLEFQIEHFSETETKVAAQWHVSCDPPDVREFSHLLATLVPMELYNLLNTPCDHKPLVMLSLDNDLFTNPGDVAQSMFYAD